MRLQLVTVLSILLAATAAHAQSVTSSATCDLPHASGVSMQQLTSGQRQRSYRLFVPPGYDGHARLSLVLDLHGSGGNAAGQARNSGLEALSANERFIVATLEAEGGRWNVPVQDGRADDVAYVSDVISHVAARVCTDETRVYATGFSGGGADVVAAWLQAWLSPRRDCPRFWSSVARSMHRASNSGADVPRAGRPAESIRWSRRRPRRGVDGERSGCARWLGASRLV